MEQDKELNIEEPGLNTLGTAEEDLTPPEQQTTPITNRPEQESVQLKLPNGLEIALGSSSFSVDHLCDMVLFMLEQLNGSKEKPKGNSYTG